MIWNNIFDQAELFVEGYAKTFGACAPYILRPCVFSWASKTPQNNRYLRQANWVLPFSTPSLLGIIVHPVRPRPSPPLPPPPAPTQRPSPPPPLTIFPPLPPPPSLPPPHRRHRASRRCTARRCRPTRASPNGTRAPRHPPPVIVKPPRWTLKNSTTKKSKRTKDYAWN